MTRNARQAGKGQGKRGNPNILDIGHDTQFKKGYDPRRNMLGGPKDFDQWRKLAQDIMQQIATTNNGTPLKWNGEEVTFAEFVLLNWLTDKKQQEKAVEAAFGKVPQKIEGGGEGGEVVIKIKRDAK